MSLWEGEEEVSLQTEWQSQILTTGFICETVMIKGSVWPLDTLIFSSSRDLGA
jgi:hypothetical protein